ncbi:MAG: asparagine synthase (glutamine-hydrolyzing) [Nitrospirae bacterium]|nr:asparagine synthase (glutamine-hydrolyzing) [Nitrospirota bacterium]
MCGIFGFFSKNRAITTDELRMTLKALHHRGPDHAGVVVLQNPPFPPFSKWGNTPLTPSPLERGAGVCNRGESSPPLEKGDVGGCYKYFSNSIPDGEWSSLLAHTRLSIIDLSEAASQPMCNEDGKVWITYNGEIYNFQKIRNELLEKGHAFKSRSDTEVIIHGYEEWGLDVVNRLRGMFAFALFDRRKNKLFLVRDRLGVKPLKYFYDGGTFIFASELKALIHLIPRKIDLDSLNRFLTLKYIPSPDTVLEGVKKLPPAGILEFDMSTGQLRTEIYWKPMFLPKASLSFSEAKENFKKIFSEAVFMRTISDVPIGVYLSGGMDSSAMVAFLKDNGVKDINTFTIKFDRPGYDESGYARAVANRFQTSHHEFMIPELSYPEVQNIINSLDEPFGDPSYIPTYFLSKFTSEHVKVILSGDGGDEILGGYKRYFIYSRGRIMSMLPRISSSFMKRLPPEISKKSFTGKLQRISEELSLGYWGAYLLRFNGLSDSFKRYVMTPETYASLKSFSIEDIIQNPPTSRCFGTFSPLLHTPAPLSRGEGGRGVFDADFNKISNTIERLIWIDMHTYLPDYILTKTDLALMAHSVEGRNPFVDYRLVEFSNTLPPEYKFKEGGKYVLKKILEEYLPREIIYRKKMGFSPPIKYWFRANLDLLYDIFSEGNFVSGDIFDLKRIHQVIEKFKTPEINISEQLWLLTVLELWRRTYKV